MKPLQGLYAITDEKLLAGNAFSAGVEAALKGGARIIQYRDKSNDHQKRRQQAEQARALCHRYQALFIVNDDVQLAARVDADGVHMGIDDGSVSEARQQLGVDKIIGVSCYNRMELACQAREQGADYLAFGRFFSSQIKPDAVQAEPSILAAARELQLPVCAIGGIDADNGDMLLQAGADMLAVISAVFAGADIEENSRRISQLFVS